MKFMKDAMTRENQRVEQMADDFVRELGEQDDPNNEDYDILTSSRNTTTQRVGGRVSYRPGNMVSISTSLPLMMIKMLAYCQNTQSEPRHRALPSLASDTSSVTLKSTDFLSNSPVTASPILSRPVPLPHTQAECEERNPWLVASHKLTLNQKKREVAIGKDSAGTEKSKNKLRKRVKMREEEKLKGKEDATVDVSMSEVMTLRDAAHSKTLRKSMGPSLVMRGQDADSDTDSDEYSEMDAQEEISHKEGKGRKKEVVKAFEQRDLVARAFAGDNVAREFAEEKRQEVESDAPKEVDTTLAGWVS